VSLAHRSDGWPVAEDSIGLMRRDSRDILSFHDDFVAYTAQPTSVSTTP
jgi:hypothetical protein